MNEKDFERIAQMVAQVIDAKLERVDARFDMMDARFEQIDARFEQIDARFDGLKAEIISEFNHSLKVHIEVHQKGLAVLAEGHQMFSEKLDRVEVGLNKKLAAIAAELAAHRADTEAHRGIYRVKEE